jgi:uncharacterized SAM-binding protein YcdF (DUF218 family)
MPIEYRIFFKVLLLPPSVSILIGLVGLLFWAARRPRIALTLCAVSIGSLWLLATPLISDALTRATEAYPAFDPTHLDARASLAQAIVVLGGGVRRGAPEAGGDAPGLHADLRLVEGAKVARATHLPVLVSGTARETAAMRRFMEEDLQTPVRWVEGASTTTHENALFTVRLLKREGIDKIILVTSGMHLQRAVNEFSAAGFEVTPAPAEMWTHDARGLLLFVPSADALERSHTALYEWAGRLVQKLQLRATPPPPAASSGA